MVSKRNRILVVAAHGDDEVLGCGGTIAKHTQAGDRVDVLLLADGVTSRSDGDRELEKRNLSCERAAEILGVNSLKLLGLPDNKLDCLPLLEIVQPIEEAIKALEPDTLYIHHGGDLNVDHQLAHRACLTAARPQPWCTVRNIYTFEVLSSTGWNSNALDPSGFRPNHFVGIENQIALKLEALNAYEQEMRSYPHARSYKSVEALASFRGCLVGVAAAEAFEVVRQVI